MSASKAGTTVLGDTHNFGRRVEGLGDRVRKPRTIVWEQLLLDRNSLLRRALGALAGRNGLAEGAFDFVPSLAFAPFEDGVGGEVERIALAPVGALDEAGRAELDEEQRAELDEEQRAELDEEQRAELAALAGRAFALYSWLGLADLHWENLVLGRDPHGTLVFGPLDVELVLDDLARPTETKLLPDADPEYAALCRHAAGARRLLRWLGKPVAPNYLATMLANYDATLGALGGASESIAQAIASSPGVRNAPIRVLLRATSEYAQAHRGRLWPPLLEAERVQLARGDVPYFFRTLESKGLFHYGDPSLATALPLPTEGDVPVLAPLLSLERGLRSKRRARLLEEGLFSIVGAFDSPDLRGTFEAGGLALTLGRRTVVLRRANGDELETGRNLRAFVGSVVGSCECGETAEPIAVATACPEWARDRNPGRIAQHARRRRR
jgi:hypothetical protein